MRTNRISPNKLLDAQHGIIGLVTEIGELADTYKKCIFYNQDLDIENAKEELGDILWYLSLEATALGLTLEEIAKQNIDKLERRYPSGFSEKEAKSRADKHLEL